MFEHHLLSSHRGNIEAVNSQPNPHRTELSHYIW